MTDYTNRVTQLTILPKDEPIFSEMATIIEIDDEAAGEFIKVIQHPERSGMQTIKIDKAEWPTIRAAIDRMMEEVRDK